jgi:hypothetical protein
MTDINWELVYGLGAVIVACVLMWGLFSHRSRKRRNASLVDRPMADRSMADRPVSGLGKGPGSL